MTLIGENEGFSNLASRLNQPVAVFPIFNMKNVIDNECMESRDVQTCLMEVIAQLGWEHSPSVLTDMASVCQFDFHKLISLAQLHDTTKTSGKTGIVLCCVVLECQSKRVIHNYNNGLSTFFPPLFFPYLCLLVLLSHSLDSQ